MLEDLDGNGYTQHGADETMTGTTDTETKAAAMDIEGFKAGVVTQAVIKGDGSTVIEIRYSRLSYDLTFDLDNGTAATAVPTKYGAAITAPTGFTKSGYTFDEWSETVPATMPAKNSTYTAKWTANTYTVKFDANVPADSRLISGEMTDQTLTCGSAEALKTNVYVVDGYTFAGWLCSGTKYGDGQTVMNLALKQDEVVTMTAVWDPADGVSYTVKHVIEKLDGTGYEDYKTDTTRTGKTGTETKAAAMDIEGFKAGEVTQTVIKGDGSTVVEIRYSRLSYDLTFVYNNGTEPDKTKVKFGAAIKAPDTLQKTGNTFKGWSPAVAEKMPANNVTYVAQWEANVYGVTLNAKEGTVNGGNVTGYTYGIGAVLPTDVTRDGYVFGGWYDNEEYKGTPASSISETDTGDKTYYAKWNRENVAPPPVYNIRIADGIVKGKVETNRTTQIAAGTVVVTVSPDAGYETASVKVVSQTGAEITVSRIEDGVYIFQMPASDVTVSAVFGSQVHPARKCPKDHTCPIYPFTDACTTAWYHDGVHYCIEEGIMEGYPGKLFGPEDNTTRAQVVMMLWRLEGSPVVNYLMTFEDMETDAWYTEAVRWAASTGVVKGYSDKAFGPNDSITREQLVTVMWRYAKFKGVDVSVGEDTNILSYEDAFEVSEWAIPAMQWACGSGAVKGTSETTLDPKVFASRAHIATIFLRYCEDIIK